MGWDPSDLQLSRERLSDYDSLRAEDDGMTMSFLGAWAPKDGSLDVLTFGDITSRNATGLEDAVVFGPTDRSQLVPDGEAKVELGFKVTKGSTPVPNMLVQFSVEAIQPRDGWRDVNEVARRMKTNAEEFRNRVGSGQIKLLGTVSPRKVWTDSKGMAIVRYTVSNVGGNQRNIASERVSASYEAGVYRHEIDVGYDFVPVPRIPKGLQIASHTAGRHCHKDLARFLKLLGQLVANAKWKRLVTITAASLRWGGLYPPHLSHQHGGTLDLRPMSTNGKETWCNQSGQHAENYDRHHTRILVRALKHSGAAKLFFNDPKLAADGAVPLDGHHDHIHVSWLKSAALLVSVTNTELRSIIAAG